MMAFRMKVNHEQSAIVQRELFDCGHSWITGSSEISNLDSHYLFLDKDGDLTHSSMISSDRMRDMGDVITFEEFEEIFNGKLKVWDQNEI